MPSVRRCWQRCSQFSQRAPRRHRQSRVRHRPPPCRPAPSSVNDRAGCPCRGRSCPAGRWTRCSPPGRRCSVVASARCPSGPSSAARCSKARSRVMTSSCATGSCATCSRIASKALEGAASGLITGYYEPVLDARRAPDATLPRGALFSSGRPCDASPVLDAPAARHAPRCTGGAARPRDRVRRRPARRARTADPGLRPAARHRARRPGANGRASRTRVPTTIRTSRSGAG